MKPGRMPPQPRPARTEKTHTPSTHKKKEPLTRPSHHFILQVEMPNGR